MAKPDISTAKRELGWSPTVSVHDGLLKTIQYFAEELKQGGEVIPTRPRAARPNNPNPFYKNREE